MTNTGVPWTLPDDASPAVWAYAQFLAGEIPNASGLMFNAVCALPASEFLLHPEHFDWLLPADQGGQSDSSAPVLSREEAAALHQQRSLDLPLMLSFCTFMVAHAMVIDQYGNVYSNATPNSHQLQLRQLLLTEPQRAVRALRFMKLSGLAGCDRAGVGFGGVDHGGGLLEYLQGKFAAAHLPTPAPTLWVDAMLAQKGARQPGRGHDDSPREVFDLNQTASSAPTPPLQPQANLRWTPGEVSVSNNEVTVIELPVDDGQRISRILEHVSAWCATHQWEVGVAEMAAGAALVAAGLQSGAIQMTVDVVISTLSDELTARFYGGLAGSTIGALAAHLLGNIGIAAAGTAIAIPAVVLMGGGALILGLAGYGVGELITQFLHLLPSLVDFTTASSLVAVGTALLVGGARRIAKDEDVKRLVADFRDGALRLGKVAYASSLESLAALQKYLADVLQPFLEDVASNPRTAATTAALAAAGVAGGQAVAVGTVSVLGSSSLGALGVSLGLVSVPLWPVVAGGGVALAVAYGVWRMTKRQASPENLLLPPPTRPGEQTGKR